MRFFTTVCHHVSTQITSFRDCIVAKIACVASFTNISPLFLDATGWPNIHFISLLSLSIYTHNLKHLSLLTHFRALLKLTDSITIQYRTLLPSYISEHCCLHTTQPEKLSGLHTPWLISPHHSDQMSQRLTECDLRTIRTADMVRCQRHLRV